MTLGETKKIDIITKDKEGRIVLVINDFGEIKKPEERFQKLIAKLKSYVNFVLSEDFRKSYPNTEAKDVIIKVICKEKPTAEMKNIDKVMPQGDINNMITVKFEMFK